MRTLIALTALTIAALMSPSASAAPTLNSAANKPQLPKGAVSTVPAVTKPGEANQSQVDAARERLSEAVRDKESEDKTGNFEIQELMKRTNESGTLASSVRKKSQETNDSVTRNID